MKVIPHSKTTLNNSDLRAVTTSIRNNTLAAGKVQAAFANQLSEFLEVQYVTLTSSGSTAWLQILLALGIGSGDDIMLPNYICDHVLKIVNTIGARAILYDNAPSHWLTNIAAIRATVTPATKVVLVNHVFGIAFKDVETIAKEFPRITIVEDCCHALAPASTIDEIRISRYSLCSFYSFNATKLLAAGEGGAIATNNKAFHEMLNQSFTGALLSDIACSLAIAQLGRYPNFLKRRADLADYYHNNIPSALNTCTKQLKSVFFRYPILVDKPEDFLMSNKISFKRGVDSLLSFIQNAERLHHSENIFNHTISVPIYPTLSKTDRKIIVEEIKKAYD